MLGLITLVLAGKVKSDTISIDVVVLIGILTGADPNPQPKPGMCFNAHDGVGVVPAYTPTP